MAVDPKYAATTATTTTNATASRPISPLSQHHYPSQPQPIREANHNHHDPSSQSHPFLYPVSSSGRGFIPKPLQSIESSPLLAYSRGVRAHLDYLNHITTTTRHHYPPPPHLPAPSPPIKVPLVSPQTHPKAAPQSAVSDSISNGYKETSTRERSRDDTRYTIRGRKAAPGSAVSDSNGYRDTSTRERSRDDSYHVIRDRKVKIKEDASLYALCRSWLRNDVIEENQPQQRDVMKALPKPLPASMVAGYMSNKKEDEKHDDEHEENEESVEHLSPQDLLKRHIKRAKKVRARLREERLRRITRYRSRLRLLLPPPVEQFKNDIATGN